MIYFVSFCMTCLLTIVTVTILRHIFSPIVCVPFIRCIFIRTKWMIIRDTPQTILYRHGSAEGYLHDLCTTDNVFLLYYSNTRYYSLSNILVQSAHNLLCDYHRIPHNLRVMLSRRQSKNFRPVFRKENFFRGQFR